MLLEKKDFSLNVFYSQLNLCKVKSCWNSLDAQLRAHQQMMETLLVLHMTVDFGEIPVHLCNIYVMCANLLQNSLDSDKQLSFQLIQLQRADTTVTHWRPASDWATLLSGHSYCKLQSDRDLAAVTLHNKRKHTQLQPATSLTTLWEVTHIVTRVMTHSMKTNL